MLNENEVKGFSVRAKSNISKIVADVREGAKKIDPNSTLIDFITQRQVEAVGNSLLRALASVAVFAVVAIVIAAMGLYAMSTFMVGRRRKEIGIRKVLGASTSRITLLLLWDFSKPIWVALALATPLAFLFVQQFVQMFSAQIPLVLITYIYVPLLVLLLAWATVARHCIRAADSDPVNTLSYE